MHSFRFLFLTLIIASYLNLYSQEGFPVNGVANTFSPVYAFTNAHIIISYEKEIINGTLLIQDDKIIDVDSNLKIPKGAIIKDLKGDYIYPSFIDLYSDYGIDKAKEGSYSYRPQYKSNKDGAYHWNEAIHPEINASKKFNIDIKQAEKYLNSGFGVVLTHQADGLVRGTATLVSLSNSTEQECIIKDQAASVFSFKKGVSKQRYPSSQMGAIALIKQLFLDAEWYKSSKKNTNLSLNAFNNHIDLPHIFESRESLDYGRIYEIAKEFEVNFIVKGNGKEYERIEDLKLYSFPIILPINFPKKYNIKDPEQSNLLTLSKLKNWETAPFNPKILSNNNIPFCFTMNGLEKEKDFIKNLRISISKGLSKKDALKALTLTPAKLLNQEKLLGSLEKHKKANFIICSDDIFKNGIIYENWTDGKQKIVTEKISDIRGWYSLVSNNNKDRSFLISGNLDDLKMIESINDTSEIGYELTISENHILFSKKDLSLRASAYQKDSVTFNGTYQNLRGENIQFILKRDYTKEFNVENNIWDSNIDTIIPEIWTPNKAYGNRTNKISLNVIFKNGTIWTNEKEGILKNTDVAISNGKIIAIGKDLEKSTVFPRIKESNIEIINATGKHITCGIIDEHSHIAISRGVNESSEAVTAEVSIGDVINANDHNIYRQLAGGVTASQLLHGSANPIGGQSAIIKLRWGSSAEDMKIKDARPFIKFALGENVKQSNWGDNNKIRFPQTRMGVEQVFYDAFYRAKDYENKWKEYKSLNPIIRRKTPPPRQDLELNALVEILNSERFITCHSYIQSEINMLMHVADSMGFTVNTFTHILEGYKLAEKMKIHGAGASTFSDWWAYKFEVNDAIPYNATILNNYGVITSINSDDAEMGRRLNQEAAKAIKYGGTSEEDAWKMVTLNPAKLLDLDHRMGSIKEGKDADIVIWNNNPLSIYAKVEKTYIDGKLLFSLENNLKLMDRDLNEKMRIIKKMSKSKGKSQEIEIKPDKLYHCDTIEHYE